MKFGLGLTLDRPLRDVAQLVRLAEQAGFDIAWFPDHYFLREAYSAQALAAMATQRILLGTAVTSPFLRHPALLASAVASLDELSDGRAVFGLGAGGHEFRANLGQPMDRPLTAVKDTVQIVRALLGGEMVSCQGEVFSVKEARLPFAARVAVPLYLAARGRRMFRLAAEVAEGLITHGVRSRYLEAVREWTAAAKPGFDLAVMAPLAIQEDETAARDRLRAECIILAGGDYSQDVVHLLDLDLQSLGSLRAAVRASDWARAPSLVSDDAVDAYCLIGAAGRIRERLHAMEELGVGQMVFSLGPNKSQPELAVLIERIGREIIAGY